ESELQPHEVVAPIRVQNLVHADQHPQPVHELVAEADPPARNRFLAKPEEVLPYLEAVAKKVRVEADATGRLENAESTGERADPFGEHERKSKSVRRGRAYVAVVSGSGGIGRIDVDLLDRGLASRVVDHFDEIILVFGGLEAKLEIGLQRIAHEVVIGTQADD